MALENGTRVGPYEILSPIGAGCMGEVYPAGVIASMRYFSVSETHNRLSGGDNDGT